MFLDRMLVDAARGDDAPREPSSALVGLWRNSLGSTMELAVDDHNRIRGSYHTGVGIADPTAAFDVTGFAEGDAFAFTVDFGRRGSVAAWTGHHIVDDEQGERLVTLWHIARPVASPHSVADIWRAVLAGGDEFRRVS